MEKEEEEEEKEEEEEEEEEEPVENSFNLKETPLQLLEKAHDAVGFLVRMGW